MRYRNRRRTAAEWTANDEVIGQGEIALVVAATPTGAVTEMRLGDGVSTFSALSAFSTGGGGGGATTLAALTDKATIDLPAVNTPLSTALSTINTAVAAKPSLQSGSLSASTTVAASPTAIINHVASQISGLINSAPGALDTLNELAAALGNDANYATTIATALGGKVPTTRAIGGASLAADILLKTVGGASIIGTGDIPAGGIANIAAAPDKASIDLPTVNSPLATALAAKADFLANVDLGTGAVSFSPASHGNRHCFWHGTTDQTVTLGTSGATEGMIGEISNNGSGVLTLTPITAATGYQDTIPPDSTGLFEYTGGAWKSQVPNLSGGSASAWVATTGLTTTGSVRTATPMAGLTGTYQWTRDGSNISGATASTYTMVSGDEGHVVACKFTPSYYTSNGVTGTAGSVSGSLTMTYEPSGTTDNMADADWSTGWAAANYQLYNSDPSGANDAKRSGVTAIPKTLTNVSRYANGDEWTLLVSDGVRNSDDTTPVAGTAESFGMNPTSSAAAMTFDHTLPAGTGVREGRIRIRIYKESGLFAGNARLRLTLSDASATELVRTIPFTGFTYHNYEYRWTYNAGDNSSRTLRVRIECDAADNPFLGLQAVGHT